MSDANVKTVWEVREPRSQPMIRPGDHPELSYLYTTEAAARAAAEAVMERLADLMVKRAEDWSASERPDAAKRAWADDTKTACFTEQRVTGWTTKWGADRDRHRPRWWPEDNVLTLTVDTQVRHRWREVEHRREVAEDGTITVSGALGEPSEWTEWHDPLPLESGGLHFGAHHLEIRPQRMRFAPDQNLVAWAETAPDWLDAEWVTGKHGITDSHWQGRSGTPEMTTVLARSMYWFARGPDPAKTGAGPVNTWRRVCGTSGDGGDLTMDRIARAPGFGRARVRELLRILEGEGLEPTWADDARRYYRLDEADR